MKSQLKNMNLNSLYHFYVIARHRSLRTAAQELGLSAPAVTHSLGNLEENLGEVLCIRSRSEFSLTTTGLKLFQTAQKVFEHLEDFTANQNEDADFSGMLSIGILDHFEEPYFISSLEKVIKKFPKIKLNIQAFDSDTINKMLLENELDLGLAVFSQQSPRIKYVKIGEERLQYFISDKHPLWSRKKLSRDDLGGHKVAWIDNHSRNRSDLEINIFVENPKYKMQFFGFSNNLSGGLALLLSGHTVVPLSENYGDILSKFYPIKKLPFEGKARQLNHLLAHNPSRAQSAPVKMMIETLMGRNQ